MRTPIAIKFIGQDRSYHILQFQLMRIASPERRRRPMALMFPILTKQMRFGTFDDMSGGKFGSNFNMACLIRLKLKMTNNASK